MEERGFEKGRWGRTIAERGARDDRALLPQLVAHAPLDEDLGRVGREADPAGDGRYSRGSLEEPNTMAIRSKGVSGGEARNT